MVPSISEVLLFSRVPTTAKVTRRVRGIRRRDEQDRIKSCGLAQVLCDEQVARMHRVEGAAENADPHGSGVVTLCGFQGRTAVFGLLIVAKRWIKIDFVKVLVESQ